MMRFLFLISKKKYLALGCFTQEGHKKENKQNLSTHKVPADLVNAFRHLLITCRRF